MKFKQLFLSMTLAGAVLLTGCGESSDEGSSETVAALPEFDKSLIEDKIIKTEFIYDGYKIETSDYIFNADGTASASLVINATFPITCNLSGKWSTANTRAELRVSGETRECSFPSANGDFNVAYTLIEKTDNGMVMKQRDSEGLVSDLIVEYVEVATASTVELIPFTTENFVARPFVVNEPLITDAGNYITKSNNILFNEDNTITGTFEVLEDDGSHYENCDLTGSWELVGESTEAKVVTTTNIDCGFIINSTVLSNPYHIEYQLIEELGNGIEVYVTDTDLNTAIAYTVYENNSTK